MVQDIIAHAFWKEHHMATEHHHHGHHHVHKEIAEETEHNHHSSNPVPSNQKQSEEIFTHLLPTFTFVFNNKSIHTKHVSNFTKYIPTVSIEIKSPPPKYII